MDNDAPEGTCYVCGHGNPDVIQGHHIIPRRYGGSDEGQNLVDLCPSCHDAIERIYDNLFFEKLGIEKTTKPEYEVTCDWRSCTSENTYRLTNGPHEIYLCDGHRTCRKSDCGKIGTPTPVHKGGLSVLCDDHRICQHTDCKSMDTIGYKTQYAGWFVYCPEHAAENLFVKDSLEIDDNKTRTDLFRDIRGVIKESQGDDTSEGVYVDTIVEVLSDTYVPAAISEQVEEMKSSGRLYTVNYSPQEVRVV